MGDYITEEYFLTNNLLMGLLYYTTEMKVLVLILNLGDKQTKEGDNKGHLIKVPVGLCSGQI